MVRMTDWFLADEGEVRGNLLFLLGSKVGKKDEVAIGIDLDLLLHFELDGDLGFYLITAVYSILSLIENVVDELVFEGRD